MIFVIVKLIFTLKHAFERFHRIIIRRVERVRISQLDYAVKAESLKSRPFRS
jgi:hypothetical protein